MVKVHLPIQLGGETTDIDASTIKDLIDKLDQRLNSRFVNIFINGNDIRFLDNKDTKLNDGDEVSFVPSIAGGL